MTEHSYRQDRITSFRENAKQRMERMGFTPAQTAEAKRQIDLAYKQYINSDYRVAKAPPTPLEDLTIDKGYPSPLRSSEI